MVSRRRMRMLGHVGIVGDVFANFSSMSNGAPTNAATGQPIFQMAPSGAIVRATVSNGALVAADSGQPTTAAYSAIRVKEEVNSYFADVSFVDANDAAGYIVAGDINSIGNTSIHIIFTISSWTIQYYGSTVLTTVGSGSFTAVPAGVKRRVGWAISGNTVNLTLPDGTTTGPITSAALTARNNNVIIFEHFRNAPGTPGVKFYGVAANLFHDPIAAGRTNLLVNRNNLFGGSWSTTLGGLATGLPDADGGTLGQQLMETTTNRNQYVYQLIAKAAAPIRYTQRFKIKLIGRDVVYPYSADSTGSVNTAFRYLNLTTQTQGTIGGSGFTEETSFIYSLGGGWYQVQQDFISNADTGLYSAIGIAQADNVSVYAGDITKGMILYDEWTYSRPT